MKFSKFFSRAIRILVVAVVSAALLLSSTASIKTNSAKAVDSYHDDWLHVDENCNIVDSDGNPVWLTGCNWFGYNVGSQVFDGVWSQNMHSMLTQIADHGFNFLRVPMSVQILLQWKNNEDDPSTPKVNTYENPELTLEGTEGGTCMYSFDIWNQAVEWCRELGIKIMIDIHSAETNSAGHQITLWYTDTYTTDDWLEALSWFAEYYKDDDTILAIDLKNEPHGTADVGDQMAKWDDSTDSNNWKYAAEQGAAAVLEQNPNLLVMVEGVEVYPKFEDGSDWTSQNIDYSRYPYSYYHHTWWGANFRGVKDYPIDLGEYQSQLVYSPHDYGPLVYEQDWFYDGFTSETLMEDCWYDNWYYIYDEKIAPLLIGEWGGFLDEEHDTDGKNKQWMTAIRDLIIQDHLHHTFWCFNENSGDTGGLVYDNFSTWDEEKYEFVKPALWQTDDGEFVSLDHTIALGSNGISLSDYYANGNSFTDGASSSTDTDVTSSTTEATTSSETILGDFNSDGKVNIIDLSIAKETLQSEETSDVGDYNSDGEFNISDIIAITKFILKE